MPAAGRPATMPPRSVSVLDSPRRRWSRLMLRRLRARAYEGDEDEDAGRRRRRAYCRPPPRARVRSRAAARPLPIARRRVPRRPRTPRRSPAAVIRKTMESQRARGLASGPPPELRSDLDHGDNDEFTQAAPSRTVSSRSGAQRSNYPPPASHEAVSSHRPLPLRDELASYRLRGRDSMDFSTTRRAATARTSRVRSAAAR